MERSPIIGPEIRQLLDEGRIDDVRDFLKELHPYDIAEHIGDLESHEIANIVRMLGDPLGPDAFQKLDTEVQVEALQVMPRTDGARLMERMDPDELTDLVNALPEEESEKILPLMAQATRNEVVKLLTYDEGTAGSVMTTEYADVKESLTIAETLSELRRIAPDRDTLYNVFVVDDSRRLVGVIPLKDIFILPSHAALKDVMKADVKYVEATADVEEVVKVAKDYDLVSVPVVDDDRKLLGIVTVDDILDVFEEEATEDIYHYGAAGEHLRYLPTNPLRLAGERVIWLILLTVAGFFSGWIIHRYQSLITSIFALAVFIPVINASGGNAGTQASTVIIRGLATGEVSLSDSLRILWKEIAVGLCVGIVVAIVGAIRGYWIENSFRMALTVGLALVSVVTFATMLGAVLPLIFKKVKLDPAVVSGPFIASVLDIVALLIYLEIARAVLQI
jgi:magnesium transporter